MDHLGTQISKEKESQYQLTYQLKSIWFFTTHHGFLVVPNSVSLACLVIPVTFQSPLVSYWGKDNINYHVIISLNTFSFSSWQRAGVANKATYLPWGPWDTAMRKRKNITEKFDKKEEKWWKEQRKTKSQSLLAAAWFIYISNLIRQPTF